MILQSRRLVRTGDIINTAISFFAHDQTSNAFSTSSFPNQDELYEKNLYYDS
jgi:hypothetical protein